MIHITCLLVLHVAQIIYGPYHFPEKLIPLIINNILAGKPLPVYGEGLNIRDWLYVEDHCKAIDIVVREGRVGQVL